MPSRELTALEELVTAAELRLALTTCGHHLEPDADPWATLSALPDLEQRSVRVEAVKVFLLPPPDPAAPKPQGTMRERLERIQLRKQGERKRERAQIQRVMRNRVRQLCTRLHTSTMVDVTQGRSREARTGSERARGSKRNGTRAGPDDDSGESDQPHKPAVSGPLAPVLIGGAS